MRKNSSKVILNFHGIGEPIARISDGERKYWISTDFFCRILDLILEVKQDREIEVTFDDGNSSDIEIAVPKLTERKLDAAFFVLTDRIGEDGYLAESEIVELVRRRMRLGLHGKSHVDWSMLDKEGLDKDIVAARRMLCKIADMPIDTAAIPFGAYRSRTIKFLKEKGFRQVYSSDGGSADTGSFLQPRTSITDGMDIYSVRRILEGSEPFLSKQIRKTKIFLKSRII